jgi:4-hydroxyphenylacetate 3-monooxygenase
MGDEVFVQSNRTSGEVEIVIYVSDRVYVGVGSDHTDRALETFSIPGSKQACVNHLAPMLWPYDEIADSWDDCILRSWVDDRLYQEVGVSKFLAPLDILSVLKERVSGVPDQNYMVYCGTYVSVDKALGFGSNWRYQLDAPSRNRQIESSYEVVDILAEVRSNFRVPFMNPKAG